MRSEIDAGCLCLFVLTRRLIVLGGGKSMSRRECCHCDCPRHESEKAMRVKSGLVMCEERAGNWAMEHSGGGPGREQGYSYVSARRTG
jgi:hypothetical protein